MSVLVVRVFVMRVVMGLNLMFMSVHVFVVVFMVVIVVRMNVMMFMVMMLVATMGEAACNTQTEENDYFHL